MAKETNEQIMEKLKKLMAHYEGALAIGSEEEANTAAALLQKLLLKHRISADELQASRSEKARSEEVVEEYMSTYTKKSIGGDWEFMLMHYIAQFNLCRLFWNGPRKRRMMVILGAKENIEFCKWLHSMLMNTFVGISKKRYEEHTMTREWQFDPIGLDTFQRRYLLGCADGIRDKFLEEKRERERANDTEGQQFALAVQGLVKRADESITKYVETQYGQVGTSRGRNIAKGDAYTQGLKDGRAASINKPIATTKVSNTKLLG